MFRISKRHRKELIAGAIESSLTMEAATKRSGVDRRTLSRILSVSYQFFPSLDFFGSFFGYEKKNKSKIQSLTDMPYPPIYRIYRDIAPTGLKIIKA